MRAKATKPCFLEQEVAIDAIVKAKDFHSIPILKKLTLSSHPPICLAASLALYQLGETGYEENIIKWSEKGNLFAISMLQFLKNSENILLPLLSSPDPDIQYNAAFSLAKKDHPLGIHFVLNLLKEGQEVDLLFSPAKTFTAYKRSKRKEKKLGFYLLQERSYFSESAFLQIVEIIWDKQDYFLFPLLLHSLPKVSPLKVKSFLKRKAKEFSPPLSKIYANIGLYSLGKMSCEEYLTCWLKKHQEFFFASWKKDRNIREAKDFTQESISTASLIAYDILAHQNALQAINILLYGMAYGPKENIYPLAGLLLQALQ